MIDFVLRARALARALEKLAQRAEAYPIGPTPRAPLELQKDFEAWLAQAERLKNEISR